jgi:hypothetical protein
MHIYYQVSWQKSSGQFLVWIIDYMIGKVFEEMPGFQAFLEHVNSGDSDITDLDNAP